MINCLIIDDDPDDQEIVGLCIKTINKDICCRIIDNGVDALIMLSSEPDYIPNYILIDFNMPKINGIECLKVIRQIEHLNDTKIYMYLTTAEESMIEESQKLGASGFILKPFKTKELIEQLSKILGLPKV